MDAFNRERGIGLINKFTDLERVKRSRVRRALHGLTSATVCPRHQLFLFIYFFTGGWILILYY